MAILRGSAALCLLASLTTAAAVACGGTVLGQPDGGTRDSGAGGAGGHPGHDAGPPVDTGTADEGTGADAGDSGGGEAEAAAPSGALVTAGKDLLLWGVTSDGYAIYGQASSTPTLYAAPIGSSGSPVKIAAMSSQSFYVQIAGSVVLLYSNIQPTSAATLQTWTASGGLHTLTTATYAYTASVSKDGAYVTYFDHFSPSTLAGDAYASGVDGTGAKLLRSVTNLSRSGCYPELMFVGTAAVLSVCATSTGYMGDVYSYSGSGWPETRLGTGVYAGFTPDPSGKNVLIYATTGMEVVPATGGTATTIDASAQSGVFTSDGSKVVYVRSGGTALSSLYESSVASPSPTMLTSGVEGILGLSPDNGTALLFKSYDMGTYLFDVYSASAKKAGSLTTLNKSTTSTFLYGSSFTNDGATAVLYENVSTTTYLGTLVAAPVSGGKATTLSKASDTAWASGPSKIVFEDNYAVPVGSSFATVDIKSFDTAKGGAPSLVVSGALSSQYGPGFFLTPGGDSVVYSENAGGGATGGIYVVKVP